MNKNKKIGIGIIVVVVLVILAIIYQKKYAPLTYTDPSELYSFKYTQGWKVTGGGAGTIPAATQVTVPTRDTSTGANPQIIVFLDVNDTLLNPTLLQFPTKKVSSEAVDGYMTDKYTAVATSGPILPTIFAIHLNEATSTKVTLVAYSTNYDIAPFLSTFKINKGLIMPTAAKVQAVLVAAMENAQIKAAKCAKAKAINKNAVCEQ